MTCYKMLSNIEILISKMQRNLNELFSIKTFNVFETCIKCIRCSNKLITYDQG